MNRTRGRVHLNERQEERRFLGLGWPETDRDGYEFPNPPDNFDFVEIHTPEQADAIETRFRNGIELGAIYDQRAKRLVKEASRDCHARFHAPKRHARKQRELKASLADVARKRKRA
jgi:hypothetical protein